MVNQSHKSKSKNIIQIVIIIGIALALNFVALYVYKRFDLTKEKRYTLGDASQKIVQDIDETVTIKVYLEGDFPAGFKRLRNSIKDMLYELKSRNSHVEYEFINPDEGKKENERQEMYRSLSKKGINPVNLSVNDDGESTQKIIFPGAEVSYKGKTLPINLLENQIGFSPEENLNNSISLLEYKLINTIDKLSYPEKPFVGFLTGHGNPSLLQLADTYNAIKDFYFIDTVNLSNIRYIPQSIRVLIVAKPLTAFDEKEKFKIDQYIMNGGKILWLLDKTNADLSLFAENDVQMPTVLNLNLDDMLFKYGARVNDNLAMDLQCDYIPLVSGKVGNNPQIESFRWMYFPVMQGANNSHPIIKNLDAVVGKFTSTIDIIKSGDIKATPLLQTSRYSRTQFLPMRVSLDILKQKPDPRAYNQPYLTTAVLLEGEFTSLYKNRMAQSFLIALDSLKQPFKSKSVTTKMIVVADGDVIVNEINAERGSFLPLGFNKQTKITYSNRDFISNCIEYLIDEKGVISARNKEWKMRLLDKNKAKLNRVQIQVINLLLPLVLLFVFGLIFNYIRHRRYTK